MTYELILSGCDDRTTIEEELSAEQLAFVKRLAEAFNAAADYHCKPRFEIRIGDVMIVEADA